SYEQVQARAGPILDRLAVEHAGEDVVVVSHGGVMMTLWAYVAGTWEAAHAPSNCGMVLIEHGSSGYAKPVIIDGAVSARDTGG
ncbi:MAG TPA: histidine phosphatase family protein, partial [Steroidobacteraceae bacterium]